MVLNFTSSVIPNKENAAKNVSRMLHYPPIFTPTKLMFLNVSKSNKDSVTNSTGYGLGNLHFRMCSFIG